MIQNHLKNIFLACYNELYIPIRSLVIRHKKCINVTFVLSELSVWKTELLYKAMEAHSRFNVSIAVVDSLENPTAKPALIAYLESRGYDYLTINKDKTIVESCHSDIIFYQKPYPGILNRNHQYSNNYKALFCFVTYGLHSVKESWIVNQPLNKCAWQVYFENESALDELAPFCNYSTNKMLVTGYPMQDEYLTYDYSQNNPWKFSDKRKCIIWAPHHSLPGDSGLLHYSTFIDYHQTMLNLAIKYREYVKFAFKPHPLLRPKLEKLWGKERTDKYYMAWSNNTFSQLAEGEYVDLFMHSDAIIHDCGSFTIEYMYTHKPALYLEQTGSHDNKLIEYAQKAYDLHYKAYSERDIEDFINTVISGKDPKKEERERYIKEELTPHGGSACENIIAAILGEKIS